MSTVQDGLNTLNLQITKLAQVKQDYIAALRSKGLDIPDDIAFIDIPDKIYNLGFQTTRHFIFANSADFPNGRGATGILNKSIYMKLVRDAILNALEARGKAVPTNKQSLNGMVDFVRSDFGNTRKEPILASLTPINIDTMELNVPEVDIFRYKINN